MKLTRVLQGRTIRYILIGFLLVSVGLLTHIFWDMPSINSLPETYMTPSVRITDRNGRLLYEFIP